MIFLLIYAPRGKRVDAYYFLGKEISAKQSVNGNVDWCIAH